jgi:hypothetical protein
LTHENTEQDAGPNDEERGQPHVPKRTSLARSSSSVSFALASNMKKTFAMIAAIGFASAAWGDENASLAD